MRPLMLGVLLLPIRPSAHPPRDPFTIMAAFDRIAARPLWPGFDPSRTPVAIFESKRTLLFRHPAPPAGFTPLEGHPGIYSYPGQHESVRANTHAVLGGVQTATFILDRQNRGADSDLAAVIVHETFHVFQAEHHPGWYGNEGDMLAYPMDDSLVIRLQRLETEALRRAVGATTLDSAGCWAGAALTLREQRFAALPASSAAYERGTELNEGLATYVEYLASGHLAGWNIAAKGFGPDEVRLRTYSTGPALAALLDRSSSDWKDRLDQDSTATLEGLLRASLGPGLTGPCRFTALEETREGVRARADLAALKRRLAGRRRSFLDQRGWTVDIVVDSGEPLWPQAFDPWNIARVAPGELLHGRWIKLGNQAGTIEVLDRASLTSSAGEHPLFNGVRRVTITGILSRPVVDSSDSSVSLRTTGVEARFRGASVERSGQRIVVHLHP